MLKTGLKRLFSTEGELKSILAGAKEMLKIKEVAEISLFRLHTFDEQFQDINDKISSGRMSGAQMNRIRGKIDTLTYQSRLFNDLKGILEDAAECKVMLEESGEDKEAREMIQEEITELQEQIEELTPTLLENILDPEEFDDCEACTMEFRPGVGGIESMLFAGEMYNVYKNFCKNNGWMVKEKHLQMEGHANKALKLGILEVKGMDCYYRLKCESGVHKVIRVPETEKHGRLHSSVISIAVLPEVPFVSCPSLII